MKKIYALLVLLFLPVVYYGFMPSESKYTVLFNADAQGIMIPDVMNKVNVLGEDGKSTYTIDAEADSFPLFPGFPVHVAGGSYEGGIFCNMDSDNDLEIVYNATYNIYALNLDGSNVPGWPKPISPYPLECAPSFGDIDGDGQGEIVAAAHGLTSGGYIYAFKKNGTPVSGFPIDHGYSTRTPVLADLDNNNTLEIIVNERVSRTVKVYTGNGSVYPGWPQMIDHVPASSAAVGDITGDGVPEIIAESYYSLYAWSKNGDTIPGFPFSLPSGTTHSYSSPVLADLDGDNIREIVWGTHGISGPNYVYCMKNNGTVMPGWPKTVGYWIYGPPAVGYIDNDNIIDIAVGDQVLSSSPTCYIYAWNKNGTLLSGFPIGPIWSINNQVSLGDIDNDNMTELIVDDNTQTSGIGKYLAFNHDGSPLAGWPIFTAGTTFFNMPCLVDINHNGILDIIGSSVEGSGSNAFLNIYLWNTGTNLNAPKMYNPIWQYNERHNGVYGDNPLVGIEGANNSIPVRFELYQNYPNPFNPSTKIKFDVAANVKNQKSNVRIAVYDALGKEVAVIVDEEFASGTYEVTWDATGFSSGVYFCSMVSGTFSGTARMVVLK